MNKWHHCNKDIKVFKDNKRPNVPTSTNNKNIKETKQDMKKYFKFFLAGVIALVFIGTFVFLYVKSRPQPVVYDEFTPKVMDIKKTTVVTGKIEPRDEVAVKPQISGIITALLKEPGNTVKEGEVIAKVKVIPDMASLSSAQARVRLANINVQQSKTDYDRERVLYDKGLVSADEYDKIKQTYDQAKEEAMAAQDNLEVVRDGVSRSNANASSTLIRSTITGVILDIPIKVGNSVILSNTFNDGTTIATVANMNDLIFRGNIDETEVGRLIEGMNMKITIGALQDLKFSARLEYISPKAVDSNGANQFEIKAAVNVDGTKSIRSGYSATAEIVLASAANVLTVPESAIEFDGGNAYVYVVKGDGDNKTYERRKVQTGLSDGINIEVRSGITEKDIVRGQQRVDEH